MRAISSHQFPESASDHGVVFEPKWDGFRAILWVTRDGVRLQSRNQKDLSSHFPDLCEPLSRQLPPGLVLDGEIIIWDQSTGRTSFELLQRRFTAGRRITEVAAAHPAHFVAFDLLQDARGHDLLDRPLHRRRDRLQRLLKTAPPQIAVCPQTSSEKQARAWIADWAPAGIEGVVIKPSDSAYQPGRGAWRKLRTHHTADYIIGGLTGSFERPSSLLLGRYDQHGVLRFTGQTHRIRAEHRPDLARLKTMAFRGDTNGHPWPCPLPSGWTADLTNREPLPYLQVEPTLVAEVEIDTALDGPFDRLRHRGRLLRIRAELQSADVERLETSPRRHQG
jgi:ATP-dependent DNA ligase